MCSEPQYQSCRDNSPSLNKMCKLADSNSYWQDLSSAERAAGFAHFRSETLRKAQSAFLFRCVARGGSFASAPLSVALSRLTFCRSVGIAQIGCALSLKAHSQSIFVAGVRNVNLL
jgi:hypothetical protein